jgi:nucleoside-diphosphate-sugar epimerase
VQNVLVTGATGFIGIEVSRQLAHRGLRPRLMVRRPVRGRMLKNLAAEIVQTDLRSVENLDHILNGVDTVFHLGARAAFEPYARVYLSIVNDSLNLMQAAIKAGVKKFVFASTLLVYGDSDKPIDQHTQPAPMSGYGRAKLEAEQRLAKMAADAGICFVCLRLPHVYGAQSLLFDRIRQGQIFFPGKGDNAFAHIHIYDAARAFIQAAENGQSGIWVVADELSCTWNHFFETLQTHHPRLRVMHVPRMISYVGTKILYVFFKLSAQANPYPSGAISCWNYCLPVVPGTLRQAIGLEPKFPSIHEGIPVVLDDAISFYWLPSNLDLY